jgi:hypothetical protein
MGKNKPIQISDSEWKEIMEVKAVRDGWGLEKDATVDDFCSIVYGVKFNFRSGSPGYSGDLYIIQDDTLEIPVRLIRSNGKLKITS